jgi:integrase
LLGYAIEHVLLYCIFSDWRKSAGLTEEFEKESVADLAKHLYRFYGEARTKDGETYSKSSMRGIRAAINRHMRNKHRNIDLVKDSEFSEANMVFDGYLKEIRREGKDTSKHHDTLTDADWKKLHESEALKIDNPTGLQKKVFVDIVTHFGRRGREGLRWLKKNSFLLLTDENGKEYYEPAYKELTKNDNGLMKDDIEYSGIMYSQPGDPRCPVASFKTYISKLHPASEYLFTYPCKGWKGKQEWFSTNVIGHNILGGMMKELSSEVGLSKVYTNHCLRATVATRLSRRGVEAHKITHVTGHRNVNSLKSYIEAPTLEERASLSSILHSTDASTNRGVVPYALGVNRSTQQGIIPHALGSDPTVPHVECTLPVCTMGGNSTNVTSTVTSVASTAMFNGAVFNGATINFHMK